MVHREAANIQPFTSHAATWIVFNVLYDSSAQKMFATSPYTDTVMTPELIVDPLPVETGGDGLIWVVGPVLAVVFIICIVIAILLYKK